MLYPAAASVRAVASPIPDDPPRISAPRSRSSVIGKASFGVVGPHRGHGVGRPESSRGSSPSPFRCKVAVPGRMTGAIGPFDVDVSDVDVLS
jgi:hypothetical protein